MLSLHVFEVKLLAVSFLAGRVGCFCTRALVILAEQRLHGSCGESQFCFL